MVGVLGSYTKARVVGNERVLVSAPPLLWRWRARPWCEVCDDVVQHPAHHCLELPLLNTHLTAHVNAVTLTSALAATREEAVSIEYASEHVYLCACVCVCVCVANLERTCCL